MRRSQPPRDAAHVAAAQWAEIREAATVAIVDRDARATDTPGAYVIHAGGATHRVTSLATLADVTRAERRRDGIAWPEDGGAQAMHHRQQGRG